ncbi:uncharacterized protein LOC125218776 [Salvia hispanica]|uniref:uncharacterized protein LOC125218776 n=1 Tax=Salvia hispanica TaxID=49212 RepID=UPI0020094F34|nr:uncharacterized protein LOC125218776 [Salvia hispanica]XP_047976493.1 uncharacterized protein LOC125218776 [Salvia hispanica]
MEWYYRITITYITQSGRHPDVGMNTCASSLTLAFETLGHVYHLSRGFDPTNAVGLMHDINRLVLDCLNDCGESESTFLPTTHCIDVDISQGFIQRARGSGRRGVRIGGHDYSRHFRMSVNEKNMNWDDNLDVDTLVENVENEPQMRNPPAPDASAWFPTWSDTPQSSWVTSIEKVGLPCQLTT